jgi:hypothetical protein
LCPAFWRGHIKYSYFSLYLLIRQPTYNCLIKPLCFSLWCLRCLPINDHNHHRPEAVPTPILIALDLKSLSFNLAPRHEGVLKECRYSHKHFDLGTGWRRVVIFTPRPLYSQEKSPWYPLGGLQSRSGQDGEEKNFQLLPVPETPIIEPVARRCTTELSWWHTIKQSWKAIYVTHYQSYFHNANEGLSSNRRNGITKQHFNAIHSSWPLINSGPVRTRVNTALYMSLRWEVAWNILRDYMSLCPTFQSSQHMRFLNARFNCHFFIHLNV